ncbi:imidazolonepropionase [Paenibacillus tarimensis]
MIYIKNASQLITVGGASGSPKRGAEMEDLQLIDQGGAVVDNGVFVFVGRDEEAERVAERYPPEEVQVIDASGRIVTPGLIDPHTHLVFAGSREFELEKRLKGVPYMEIHRQGGGILHSTRQTRAASEEQLVLESKRRLDRFLQHGVTTVEAKSGYGLTVEHELKQLRVAGALNAVHPVDVVPTFMGAHAVPEDYQSNPDEYVQLVIEEMAPRVAREGLAHFIDVFCEKGVFTVAQSRRILEAGKRLGLKPKLHADELAPYGGAELAAEIGAVSADHLLQASEAGIRAMAKAGVIGVLLPGTAFYLMAQPANARYMIESGLPVSLSTDCNPGSSPTESLPFIMNLACFSMKMTPAEVITACTINAAHAIGMGGRIGSIEAGKQADAVMFDAPNYHYLQYHYGVNLVHTVLKKGKVIIENGERGEPS